MKKKTDSEKSAVSRREFFKIGGTVAAGLQVGAVAGAGLAAGKDPATHTGWQHLDDHTQFVDRTKMIRKGPAYQIVGEVRRPQATESVMERQGLIMNNMQQYKAMISSFDAGEAPKEDAGGMSMGEKDPNQAEKRMGSMT